MQMITMRNALNQAGKELQPHYGEEGIPTRELTKRAAKLWRSQDSLRPASALAGTVFRTPRSGNKSNPLGKPETICNLPAAPASSGTRAAHLILPHSKALSAIRLRPTASVAPFCCPLLA